MDDFMWKSLVWALSKGLVFRNWLFGKCVCNLNFWWSLVLVQRFRTSLVPLRLQQQVGFWRNWPHELMALLQEIYWQRTRRWRTKHVRSCKVPTSRSAKVKTQCRRIWSKPSRTTTVWESCVWLMTTDTKTRTAEVLRIVLLASDTSMPQTLQLPSLSCKLTEKLASSLLKTGERCLFSRSEEIDFSDVIIGKAGNSGTLSLQVINHTSSKSLLSQL